MFNLTQNRIGLLNKFLNFEGNINSLKKELIALPWDSEELVSLKREHILHALDLTIKQAIPLEDLTLWANLIEGREDIKFNSEAHCDVIDQLANPDLYGILEIKTLEILRLSLLENNAV